jgi:hypothetical protein
MLHVLAALAMTAVVAAISSSEPPHRTLVVWLIHRCGPATTCLPSRIVGSMRTETERVWSPLDVRLAWIDSVGAAATHSAGITVMLEEGDYPESWASRDMVLAALTQPAASCGWGVAHVWVRQIERHTALIRHRDHSLATLPAALADTLLSRALGRALAHEIGHYLLGTHEHTARGLMRARFTPQDLIQDPVLPLYGLDTRDRARLIACRTDQDTALEGTR